MDPSENPWPPPQPPPSSSSTTPRKEISIQGPRPTPLRVSRDSVKIKKPPIVPRPVQPPPAPVPVPAANQPVIIYSISPKPIFVEASNFRSLVQHLTGRDQPVQPATSPSPAPVTEFSSTSYSGEVPVSPAARLAAIERTSPKEWDRRRGGNDENDQLGGVDFGLEMMGQMPGILSPAPANLPAMSPGMFSPMGDGQTLFGMSEIMSPFMGYNMSFLPSPSALFLSSVPIVSPSPTGELFNIFDF